MPTWSYIMDARWLSGSPREFEVSLASGVKLRIAADKFPGECVGVPAVVAPKTVTVLSNTYCIEVLHEMAYSVVGAVATPPRAIRRVLPEELAQDPKVKRWAEVRDELFRKRTDDLLGRLEALTLAPAERELRCPTCTRVFCKVWVAPAVQIEVVCPGCEREGRKEQD